MRWKKLSLRGGQATGVRYRKKGDKSNIGTASFAKHIIANAAIPNVIEKLVKDNRANERLRNTIGEMDIAPSILSVYLGFKKPLSELGHTSYSTILFDEGLKNQKLLNEFYYSDFSKRSIIFADYSQLDSALASDGKGVGVICAFDRLDDWTNLTREQYKIRKEEVAQILIDRLEMIIPGVRDQIEYIEVSTPLTIKRYTMNPGGTPYGYSQIKGQAGRHRPKIKSPVKNLYFASAWTEPGQGFSGAILSGSWCADEILSLR